MGVKGRQNVEVTGVTRKGRDEPKAPFGEANRTRRIIVL
jgi:hypothetical protein